MLTGVSVGLAAGTATTYLIELRVRDDPNASVVRARTIGTSVNVGALGVGPLVVGALAQWTGRPPSLPYVAFVVLGAIALLGLAATPETGAPSRHATATLAEAGIPVAAAAATIAAFSESDSSPACPSSSWPRRFTRPRPPVWSDAGSWSFAQGWCPSWRRQGCGHRMCSRSA
jgi:hypothetical protein